jgi:hypothetical protein
MKSLGLPVALLIALCAAGCAKGVKPYEPQSKNVRTIYLPAHRTEGPEPVYARTRWVHPPEVLPARSESDQAGERDVAPIQPVFHLSMKNATLEDVGRSLAGMTRYSSYVSPSLAHLKFSFDNLGTVDELAGIIEEKALVKVVVDHENKEIRILMRSATEPTLYSE